MYLAFLLKCHSHIKGDVSFHFSRNVSQLQNAFLHRPTLTLQNLSSKPSLHTDRHIACSRK